MTIVVAEAKRISLNLGVFIVISITIFDLNSSPKQSLTQSGFFEQCFGKNNLLLPINDEFSETIDIPGQYEIQIELILTANTYKLQWTHL